MFVSFFKKWKWHAFCSYTLFVFFYLEPVQRNNYKVNELTVDLTGNDKRICILFIWYLSPFLQDKTYYRTITVITLHNNNILPRKSAIGFGAFQVFSFSLHQFLNCFSFLYRKSETRKYITHVIKKKNCSFRWL